MNTQAARMTGRIIVVLSSLAGCGASGDGASGPAAASTDDASAAPSTSTGDAAAEAAGNYPGADIGLAPVASGYVRYMTTPLMVAPGQDVFWEEWVAPPLTEDTD